MRLLISDVCIASGGHYLGQAQYIIDHFKMIEDKNPGLDVVFLFNKRAEQLLKVKPDVASKVHYLSIVDAPFKGLKEKMKILSEINDFCKNNQVDQMILTQLDTYQVPLLTSRFNCKVSGILYRPHHRLPILKTPIEVKIQSSFYKLRKKVGDRLLVMNSSISNIFILNDNEGANRLNSIFRTTKFKYLPDPIYTYNWAETDTTRHPTGKDVFKYLQFGDLNDRKNAFNVLKAYDLAKLDFPSELLFVGPATDENLSRFNELLQQCSTIDGKHKRVFMKRGFVTNQEMEYYFSLTDVTLLAYKNFYGSSGLMGRAALHGKKMIGCNVGVVNSLISEYRLGLTCDANDVIDIAKSLVDIKTYDLAPEQSRAFYENYSPEHFMEVFTSVS